MNIQFKPYEGNESYVFISYCREDTQLCQELVSCLGRKHVRVWYDDAIHVGEEWPTIIATKLKASHVCIQLITENFVGSVNCNKELSFAAKNGVASVPIFIEGTNITPGMDLMIGNVQYIKLRRDASGSLDLSALDEVFKSQLVRDCISEDKPTEEGPTGPETEKPKSKKPWILLAGILAAFAVAGALIGILGSAGGVATVEDWGQTKLLLHLEPQESASYADVQHDTPIVVERLKAVSEDVQVTVAQDMSVDAVIPLSCLFTDNDFDALYYDTSVNSVIETVLASPLQLAFAKVSGHTMWYSDDAMIARDDIREVQAMTVGQANTDYGLPLEIENYDRTITQLRKNYACLIITLTEEAAGKTAEKAAAIDAEAAKGGTDTSAVPLSIGHISNSEGTYYPVTVALEDGVSYAVVPTRWYEYQSWDGIALANSLVYSYTHEALNSSYSYSYELSPNTTWVDTAEDEAPGKLQCNIGEMPEDVMAFYFLAYSSDTMTEEEYADTLTVFKDMLDIIGEPYAIGSSVLDAHSVTVCTVPDKLSSGIVNLLCSSELGFDISNRETYDRWDVISVRSLEVSDSKIVQDESTGMYRLEVTVTDPEELETVTEDILEYASRKSLYLEDGTEFMKVSLSEAIHDGVIPFDELPFLRMEEIPEEYKYILELIKYRLDRADYDARRGVYAKSYYMDSYAVSSDSVRFGVRVEADDSLTSYIEENYPGAKAYVQEFSGTVWVFLHQEVEAGFISEALDKVEAIFQETQLDSLDYDVIIPLIDEEDDMRCRLIFAADTLGTSQYMSCTIMCQGDWLDAYSAELEKEVKSREFFQKRAIYTWG